MSEHALRNVLQRMHAQRLNRRRLVQSAVAGAVVAGVAGTNGLAERAVAAPLRQIDASTLVIADHIAGDQWLYLDPGRFYEINSAAALNMIYETLYHAPDGANPTDFEPLLASEMPQVSEDGLEIVIPLRAEVAFQNTGNEMTADDWVFSWNRLKNVNGNGAFLAALYLPNFEAVDPLTLRITLERPIAPLVPILASLPLAVMDSAALRENGGSDAEDAVDTDTATEWINDGNSAGTGPFRLTAWDKTGEIVLERHDAYWGEAPALDRLIWRNIEVPTEQLRAVQVGEVDVAYSLDPDSAPEVEGDENLQLIEGPSLAIEYMALNTTEDVGGPLASQELRQAIGYAIDYEGIVNDLMGGGAENPGPATIVPLPLLGTEEAQASAYTTDLTRAQELFDASGLGAVEITLSYGSSDNGVGGLVVETLATKLQSDLQQIQGLTLTLNPMDPETRLADYRAGNIQMTVSPWTPDFADVDSYAVPFAHPGDDGTAARRVGYNREENATLLADGLAELDEDARRDLYLQVQQNVIEDAPFLILYQAIDRKPARSTVQGVTVHPIYQIQLRGASKSA